MFMLHKRASLSKWLNFKHFIAPVDFSDHLETWKYLSLELLLHCWKTGKQKRWEWCTFSYPVTFFALWRRPSVSLQCRELLLKTFCDKHRGKDLTFSYIQMSSPSKQSKTLSLNHQLRLSERISESWWPSGWSLCLFDVWLSWNPLPWVYILLRLLSGKLEGQ